MNIEFSNNRKIEEETLSCGDTIFNGRFEYSAKNVAI